MVKEDLPEARHLPVQADALRRRNVLNIARNIKKSVLAVFRADRMIAAADSKIEEDQAVLKADRALKNSARHRSFAII